MQICLSCLPFANDDGLVCSEDCVHVMFWEGKEAKMKTSFADIHYTLIRPWTDRDAAEDIVPKNRRRRDWNDAIDLAEEMVLLTQGINEGNHFDLNEHVL